MSIADCRLIELHKISDPRGNLTFIEGGRHIPFDISPFDESNYYRRYEEFLEVVKSP